MAEPMLKYWKLNTRSEFEITLTNNRKKICPNAKSVMNRCSDVVLREILQRGIPSCVVHYQTNLLFNLLKQKFPEENNEEEEEEEDEPRVSEWRYVGGGKVRVTWGVDDRRTFTHNELKASLYIDFLDQVSKTP